MILPFQTNCYVLLTFEVPSCAGRARSQLRVFDRCEVAPEERTDGHYMDRLEWKAAPFPERRCYSGLCDAAYWGCCKMTVCQCDLRPINATSGHGGTPGCGRCGWLFDACCVTTDKTTMGPCDCELADRLLSGEAMSPATMLSV